MSEHQPDTGGHCLKHTVGVGKGASTRPNTVPRTNTVTKSYCVPGSRHKRAVEKKTDLTRNSAAKSVFLDSTFMTSSWYAV